MTKKADSMQEAMDSPDGLFGHALEVVSGRADEIEHDAKCTSRTGKRCDCWPFRAGQGIEAAPKRPIGPA